MNSEKTEADKPQLVDRFGRQVNYLRLSVTDRCNLRCIYCMDEEMEFLPKSSILSIEEIFEIAKAFVELGVTKIRLTGGEPLVRQGLVELCEELSALSGLSELAMTTNGVLLPKFALPLKQAGLDRINISLDTLKADRFKEITRTGNLAEVLDGIEAARSAGFNNTKINAVVLRGVNDDEIVSMAEFAMSRHLDISFIEEMPLGEISSHYREQTQLDSEWILQTLRKRFTLSRTDESTGGPSRYYRTPQSNSRVGFISPISDNFCASCNRVRLTTEGRLLLCLGNEHSVDLRSVVRNRPQELHREIHDAMTRKPERHYFDPSRVEIVRFMNATGG